MITCIHMYNTCTVCVQLCFFLTDVLHFDKIQSILNDTSPCYIFYRLDERNAFDNYLWIFLSFTPDDAMVSQIHVLVHVHSAVHHYKQELHFSILQLVHIVYFFLKQLAFVLARLPCHLTTHATAHPSI